MTLNELLGKTIIERHNLFYTKCNSDFCEKIVRMLKKNQIKVINVGYELAQQLDKTKDPKIISLEAHESLKNLLESTEDKIIAIFNLGILFEPILNLNPGQILKTISKTKILIIIWENEVENNILHWTSQKDKYNLDFSDIDLKTIEIENEI